MAIRHSTETENYHTGRGGAGNERHVSPAGIGSGSDKAKKEAAAAVDKGTGGDHAADVHHHGHGHERQHSLADKLKWKLFGKPKGHETEVTHVSHAGEGH